MPLIIMHIIDKITVLHDSLNKYKQMKSLFHIKISNFHYGSILKHNMTI